MISLGQRGLNLTKTPYLVLFILLGAVGVSTAYALVVIADDLTVKGNTSLEGNLHMGGGIGPQPQLVITENPSDYTIQSLNVPLKINKLGNDVIFNENSGNVGIGTATPAEELEVVGQILGIPIAGQWFPDTDTTNAGEDFVVFTDTAENLPDLLGTTYFDAPAGNTWIEINQAGTYRITAHVNQDGASFGEAALWVMSRSSNTLVLEEQLCQSFGVFAGVVLQSSCSVIDTVSAGDRIRIQEFSTTTRIEGDNTGKMTFLNIERLN